MSEVRKPYEVEKFDITQFAQALKVYIYRNTDSANILSSLYDSVMYLVTDTLFTYTDPDTNAFDSVYFYLGAINLSDTIDPTKYISLKASTGPFSQALSNLEDNRLKETTNTKNTVTNDLDFQIFPNPLTGQSAIFFTVNEKSYIKLEIKSLDGKTIAILENSLLNAGSYKYPVPINRINSNQIYFISLKINGIQKIKRVVTLQ